LVKFEKPFVMYDADYLFFAPLLIKQTGLVGIKESAPSQSKMKRNGACMQKDLHYG
jgi:hypothetical protein